MNPEQHAKFPTKREFLDANEKALDESSKATDVFTCESGEKLPASVDGLGTVLSMLYRAACCAWGCREGDHQLEWLTGRVVNQGICAYRLIRAGYYDESLVLIRGTGEIANLLWLFSVSAGELAFWKAAGRKERMREFGPASVRTRLEKSIEIGAPIDNERYRQLCEIGTHPVPGFAPGHYTGSGRPVLGAYLQPVGVYVSVTELSFAIAMCAVPLSKLLGLPEETSKTLKEEAVTLLESLGAFTVLNYNELLERALQKSYREGF